jgi:hypothetical protein
MCGVCWQTACLGSGAPPGTLGVTLRIAGFRIKDTAMVRELLTAAGPRGRRLPKVTVDRAFPSQLYGLTEPVPHGPDDRTSVGRAGIPPDKVMHVEDLTLVRWLGSGSYGDVYAAELRGRGLLVTRLVAVKVGACRAR